MYLKSIFSIALIVGAIGANAQSKRPNIIIFLVDDMGWQDTSVPFWTKPTRFNQLYETPNMQRLANKGIKMTNAYSNAVCTPTRISLITGMNVARHNVTNWTNVKINSPTDHPDSTLSPPQWNINGLSLSPQTNRSVYATPLPQVLKTSGYQTIHCGKAHFAPYGMPASNPKNMGFDVNIAGTAAGHPSSYLGTKNFRGNPKDTTHGVRDLEKYHGKNIFLTEALTLEAIEAMQKTDKNKPFFLYMSHYAIHLPFDKDDRFYQKYIDKGLTDAEAKYAALIEGMDKSLGDIMNYLEAANIDKNTYIFFMTDNGGFSLGKPRTDPSHTQNLPLRQGKGSMYEGGIRTPMLVAGPTIVPASVSSQAVSVDDIFPTVLKLANIKSPQYVQTVDGSDISSFLQKSSKKEQNRTFIWHYPNNWTNVYFKGTSWASAVRQGSWKLIYIHKTASCELYNLENDIEETNNLAEKYPEKKKEMAKILTQKLKERGAEMPTIKATGKTVVWPDGSLRIQ